MFTISGLRPDFSITEACRTDVGARRSDNQRKLSNVLGMQCLDHKLRKECPREADPKNSTNCQVMATERPQDSGTRNLFVLFCFLDKKAQIANTNEARQLNQNDKQKTKTHTQKNIHETVTLCQSWEF